MRMMVGHDSLDVKIEMSLEMSQQRELATGARECDARSRHEKEGKTPPISLTSQSIKCEIGRVVPADHEAPGQQMQRRLQESEVANVRLVTAERGLALQTKRPLRQSKATEHDRGDTVQTSVWKPFENKASQQREWCPQGCGASASHGESRHTDSKKSVPIHTQHVERGRALWKVHECPHTACGRREKGSVRRARTEAQR